MENQLKIRVTIPKKHILTFMNKNQGHQKNSENSSVLHLKNGNRDETNNKKKYAFSIFCCRKVLPFISYPFHVWSP